MQKEGQCWGGDREFSWNTSERWNISVSGRINQCRRPVGSYRYKHGALGGLGTHVPALTQTYTFSFFFLPSVKDKVSL